MSIIPVMILVSMLVVLGAGIAFFWAVEHDQFEDLQSPAFLPLLDESDALARAGGSMTGKPGTGAPPADAGAPASAEKPPAPRPLGG
ncbi:MAG: cbb3-type cytochrome oxidase assembly protein CcoS [Pseudomonadota bacterium]|nr:cbb3-type cytochrome oxidase assembly protein CcoS [Pseudomonadota bacterium]